MRILCLETSARTCSVAVAEGERCVWADARREEGGYVHAEELVPMMDRGLQAVGWRPEEVEGVAVSIGPGSYTGLRIGLATAKGFAHAWGVPVVAVETPAVCVAGLELGPEVAELAEGDVAVGVIDARRWEVFAAAYRRVGRGWERLTEPRAVVLDGEGPAAHLRFGVDLGERAWFVGDAAERMAPLLEGPGRRCVGRPATAAAMVSLAGAQFAAGATADLAYATPNYGKQYTPGTARNPFAP